jgi:hypothetical protein
MPLQKVSGGENYLKTESKAKHCPTEHANGDFGLGEDAECPLYCVPLTVEDGTYAEFQTYPSMLWKPARYSCDAIERYIGTQFEDYLAASKTFNSTCDTEVKRRLESGPPCWVKDTFGLPITGGELTALSRLPVCPLIQIHTFTDLLLSLAVACCRLLSLAALGTQPPGDDHICALWFSSDKKERSARLNGATFGVRRKKLWNDLIALANEHESVDE